MVRVAAGEKQSRPNIDFVAEDAHCPGCGGGLHVHKSNRRKVVTLAHGPMEAREVQKNVLKTAALLCVQVR